MVKVKICGITRLEDAIVAVESGADFLGFILYPPSPRAITPDKVASLISELKLALRPAFARPVPPLLVGVFVNRPAPEIADVMKICDLDLAQLSGDEDEQHDANDGSPLYGRAYKAFRPRSTNDTTAIINYYTNFPTTVDDNRPRLLVDTPHTNLYGGTGETGDWALAAELTGALPGVMLAGGLNPHNVAAAVHEARPFAVDVAGGVEAAPGIKDHALVKAFIANAKTL